jgi:hypothetical protein
MEAAVKPAWCVPARKWQVALDRGLGSAALAGRAASRGRDKRNLPKLSCTASNHRGGSAVAATAGPMGPSVVQLTPEQQYEARKAERERLKAMDLQTRERASIAMMLDMLDRFVTAVERMTEQHHSAPRGCVCPPGAEATCNGVSCPRR